MINFCFFDILLLFWFHVSQFLFQNTLLLHEAQKVCMCLFVHFVFCLCVYLFCLCANIFFSFVVFVLAVSCGALNQAQFVFHCSHKL